MFVCEWRWNDVENGVKFVEWGSSERGIGRGGDCSGGRWLLEWGFGDWIKWWIFSGFCCEDLSGLEWEIKEFLGFEEWIYRVLVKLGFYFS